jgi:cytosine deaminase
MVEAADWLLRNACIADGQPQVDLALAHGQIVAIGTNLPHQASQEWDLAGRVVLPGLVDAHTHLDKNFFELPNIGGTLREAIDLWLGARRTLTRQSVVDRATRALEVAVAQGTTTLRTHVDTLDKADLIALEAILEVRERWRPAIDVQIVALGCPGVSPAYDAVLREALTLGADLVGGAPSLEADPQASVRGAFALAEQTGKPIDLHIDETEDPQANALEYLADQTLARGMQGQVTAGHCCSLAFMAQATAQRVMEKVALARINIVTLPSCNLVLMGRNHQPVPRGATRVAELLAYGINVCAASDNVADPFNPFGAYDLLQIANLTAHVAHLTGAGEILTCLDMVTTHAAQLCGVRDIGLHIGATADLVVLDATSLRSAVTMIPPRLATFKRGQLVVRTTIQRQWSHNLHAN